MILIVSFHCITFKCRNPQRYRFALVINEGGVALQLRFDEVTHFTGKVEILATKC